MTGRNSNGYPISSFENNQLSKNNVKNIERYSKGSFVHHPRRGKAHSNNAHAASSIKVNQGGMMIGLPKVGNHVGIDDLNRGNEFSPNPGQKSQSGFAAMISNS